MNPSPSTAEPAALARRDGSSIRVLAAGYGRFPQADELNPEFQTDSPRLKLSLELHDCDGRPCPSPKLHPSLRQANLGRPGL